MISSIRKKMFLFVKRQIVHFPNNFWHADKSHANILKGGQILSDFLKSFLGRPKSDRKLAKRMFLLNQETPSRIRLLKLLMIAHDDVIGDAGFPQVSIPIQIQTCENAFAF